MMILTALALGLALLAAASPCLGLGSGGASVSSVVTEAFFNGIKAQAGNGCEDKNFYTRSAFISATSTRSTGTARSRAPELTMAVRPGEEVLRSRPAADLVELQLRACRKGHRLRRAREPGQGGAGPRDFVQDCALALDEQRAQGEAFEVGLVCDGKYPAAVNMRVGYYKEHCKQFGVDPGNNITC
ncbi:unnamed protein product [Miscanthus lutarioriparius]|uniref:Uncharacterized protein n=1 Tax=Miscanthus lutarioriparius TaxID=422564 RepID=A0A811QW33_9POAL|nr:unnamed protein product [Miscanthus lutarioriparius]